MNLGNTGPNLLKKIIFQPKIQLVFSENITKDEEKGGAESIGLYLMVLLFKVLSF